MYFYFFYKVNLSFKVQAPKLIDEIDWLKKMVQSKKEQNLPKIAKYLLLSVEQCYMEFHIDMAGSSVWYHIIEGEKVIRLKNKN